MHSFENLMELWDQALVVERQDVIKSLVNHPGFVLFFQKGESIFAAPEESRIVFAKLKSNDEDEGWKKEANFMGFDLMRALLGEKIQTLFNNGDMSGIKVLTDKDDICKIIDKRAAKSPDPISGIKKMISMLGEE